LDCAWSGVFGLRGALFGAAGTLIWAAAWGLAIFFSIAYLVSRDNPALLDERRKPLIQEGQPKSL
jgi:hypothetical protein